MLYLSKECYSPYEKRNTNIDFYFYVELRFISKRIQNLYFKVMAQNHTSFIPIYYDPKHNE